MESPYPADYQATVQQVVRDNEAGYLPPLKTTIDAIDQYDIVFVGVLQLPPPVKSFLRQYDLRGKTVAPFNTNAGYGVLAAAVAGRNAPHLARIVERSHDLLNRRVRRRDEVNPPATGQ